MVVEETKISKHKVLKALNLTRQVMVVDVPDIFEGTVEVDKTYLGEQKKNKRKKQLIVDDVEAKDLIPVMKKKVKKDSIICPDTCRSYTGLATSVYVHPTVEHGEKEYVDKDNKSNHINGLEGFFGYLKRQLVDRGGIRKSQLPLYLSKYVWRYNNRDLPIDGQIDRLLNLVAKI